MRARLLALALIAALLAPVLRVQAASGPVDCAPRFVRETDPAIPVIGALGPIDHPWYGGWERPRPQLADVEGDGDFDLFICEEDGMLRFYRNDGGPFAPDFVFQSDDYGGVHDLYFTRAADLDDDGDLDLLVEAPNAPVVIDGVPVLRPGAYLYWNEGTPAAPVFVNRSTHPDKFLTAVGGVPITFFNATPDFTDLDGDGDLDMLMGDGGQGGYLLLYRNVGTASAPAFLLETSTYNDITIVFGACIPTVVPPGPRPRHGFMLFEFHDADADGHEDLFVGDQFNSNCYYLSNANSGAEVSPNFVCETDAIFPGEDGSPGTFTSYLLPAMADLDGDGDSDVLAGSGVVSDAALLHFENTGTPQFPGYALRTTDYIPELDLGRASAPAIVDLDGDGLLDVAIGVGSGQRVSYFRNTGTPTAPSFVLEIPVLVAIPNASWAAPEFADLDADGDLDLYVGTSNGAVRQFRNDAGPGTMPSYVEISDAAFGVSPGRTIRDAVDEWSVPRFLDDDRDGDLDLILGNWNFSDRASLIYFRNDGTPQAHALVLASQDYRGAGVLGQNIAPVFGDWDGDGDADLIVGDFDGRLDCLARTTYTDSRGFMSRTSFLGGIDVGVSAVPALGDLDADGDLDLVVGESGGGLNFYRNETQPGHFSSAACDPIDAWDYRPPGPPETEISAAAIELLAPNPTTGPTTARVTLPRAGYVEATITETTGRRVAALVTGHRAAGPFGIEWDGRNSSGERVAPGVYRLRIVVDGRSTTRSFVVVR